MVRRLLFTFAILVPLLGGTVGAAPAWAHGLSAEADLALAQTIAGAELTVVVRRTEEVPGPVRVDVITHRPAPGMPVALRLHATAAGRAAGRDAGRDAGSTAEVRLVAGRPGTYPVDLHAGRTGPHVLELRAGGEVSRLPFQLLVPRAATSDQIIYGAFGVAGVLLIGALVSGGMARRVPAALCGSGTAIAITVALTAGVLSPQQPTVPKPLGRPYVQLAVETTAAPRAGRALTLRLDLYDGATGVPVDDLVPHHGALTHVIVSSQDGGFFRHVHPIRTGPGQWASRLTVDRPGRYLVHVELERSDSGGQLAAGGFDVGGAAVPQPGVPAKPLRTTAGRPFTLEIDAGGGVQPWLGMAGHLIVRDDSGTFLGHVHEQSSMAPTAPLADETVAAFGPTLRFTFSFPKPGRYFAWVQYMRDFEILTVPYVVEVVEPQSSS